MIAIAVDDEPLMLGALTKAIKASDDITFVADFTSCEDALDYVKSNPVDIAFLDINMRGMGGLSLAEKIIGFCPDCKIVFCTGYEEYAIHAFKLHATGYLMKPISAKDVRVEIDNIKGIRQSQKPLTVKCFGNFEVYAKGEKLTFKRSRILRIPMCFFSSSSWLVSNPTPSSSTQMQYAVSVSKEITRIEPPFCSFISPCLIAFSTSG